MIAQERRQPAGLSLWGRVALRAARYPYAGWMGGVLLGICAGLLALAPVRYTLLSQFQFALEAESPALTHPLQPEWTRRERLMLDSVAATDSSDYLVQVGRATALEGAVPDPVDEPPHAREEGDRTLLRLTLLAAQFPGYPGAYAQLARWMTASRIRIQRPEAEAAEPDAGRTDRVELPSHQDLRLEVWALRRGQRLDSENAFWPAMLAVTYFAAQQDAAGLRALSDVKKCAGWDSYLYEEVLGQWKLYSLAYGDRGAAQKVGPLSLVAFPHLRELRHMAEVVRWLADRQEAAGNLRRAVKIRHILSRLGEILRDTAPWALEAIYGTDLQFIATTDATTGNEVSSIRAVADWRSRAAGYLKLLQRDHAGPEVSWEEHEVAASCELRRAVDLARADATYPGVPPGIPLAILFGHWMTGILIIQQVVALAAAACCAAVWLKGRQIARRSARLTLGLAALLGTGVTGVMLRLGVPSLSLAVLLVVFTTLLLLAGLSWVAELSGVRPAPGSEPASLPEKEWMALLALVIAGWLSAYCALQPVIGRMHPVAELLMRLFGVVQPPSAWETLRAALLAAGIPAALLLISALRALARGLPPVQAAAVSLLRAAFPGIVILSVAYVVVMQRTLVLDLQTSRALHEAARNDRHWVLTHTDADEG